MPQNNQSKIGSSIEEKTAGNSGSEILFTEDKKFLIKKMKTEEKNLLVNISSDYVHHLISNEKSLIAKVFGVFSISIEK